MRALLDVNVLIALMDPTHPVHARSREWWRANSAEGWASCPLTENAVVRIMSNPNYRKTVRFTPGNLIHHLDQFVTRTNHEFWPDALSFRDQSAFVRDRVHTSNGLTDIYLLALAVTNGGRLATFDQGIPISAVRDATQGHVCLL